MITLSITTGRRLPYFMQMIHSLKLRCLDFNLVNKIIIADDKSSDRDIGIMCETLGSPKVLRCNGGQLNSLLAICDNLETEYVFHTEDDWLFLKSGYYIQDAINIMCDDTRIKQVTLREWNCPHIYKNGYHYTMHVYKPLDYRTEWDIIKTNDCTYHGFTLNPMITTAKVYKECLQGIKQENISSRAWDKIMSKRFYDAGYKRVNMVDQYIKHIGNESFYTSNT